MARKVEICPACKAKNTLVFYAGGHLGMYKCKKCGYIGPIRIVKDDTATD